MPEIFWYALQDNGSHDKRKALDFRIVVSENYILPVRRKWSIDRGAARDFEDVFDKGMRAFIERQRLPKESRFQLNSELPWFDYFNISGGADLVLDEESKTKDYTGVRLYKSINCDSLHYKGALMSVFSIWAEIIDMYRSRV